MSGVGFLAAVKTFTPRRKRRGSEKRRMELPGASLPPDVVPSGCWEAAPPITPPPAFLPSGHVKAGILRNFCMY